MRGNMLVHGEGEARDDVEVFLARFCFRGERRPDMERSYFIDYYPGDERVPRLRELPDSRRGARSLALHGAGEEDIAHVQRGVAPVPHAEQPPRAPGRAQRFAHHLGDRGSGRCGRVVGRADRVDRESLAPCPAIRARPAGAGGLQGSRNVARLAPREHLVGRHPPGPTGPDRRGERLGRRTARAGRWAVGPGRLSAGPGCRQTTPAFRGCWPARCRPSAARARAAR